MDGIEICEVPRGEIYEGSAVMVAIGRQRYEVWLYEKSIEEKLFPDKCWLEAMDYGENARHWVAKIEQTGEIVASARLTRHLSVEEDNYRDVKLWREKGLSLQAPVVDLGRLVVASSHRRRGIARALVAARVDAAPLWGATAALNTSSELNIGFLEQDFGFRRIGATAVFPDRPNTTFHALQRDFEPQVQS